MKLLKKLLPIASVAGIATIVTPLVTSCGASLTYTNDGKPYESKFADADLPTTEFAKDADLTKEYLQMIKDDPSIYGDDFMCANYAEDFSEYAEYSAKISIKLSSINPEAHTINAKFKCVVDYKGTYITNDVGEPDALIHEDVEFTAKDIKTEVTYLIGEQTGFYFFYDSTWLESIESNDDIHASLTATTTYKFDWLGDEEASVITEKTKSTGVMACMGFIGLDFFIPFFMSHYLSKCTVAAE